MDFPTDFGKQSTEADKKVVENVVESAKYLMPHMSVEDEENIRVKTILHLLEAKLENIYGVPVEISVQIGEEA
jgi:CxxC motif-containing protein